MARPTTYREEYCQMIIDYFNIDAYKTIKLKYYYKNGESKDILKEVPNDLPLFSGFAVKIGVHRETLINWCDKHEEFFDAYKKAKELQRNMLITNGLRGNYQTAFAIFTAKNITDMRDRQEIEHSGDMTINVDIEKDEC